MRSWELKGVKNVSASGLSCSFYNLGEFVFGRLRRIFQVMATTLFGLFALQVYCTRYAGMCKKKLPQKKCVGFVS